MVKATNGSFGKSAVQLGQNNISRNRSPLDLLPDAQEDIADAAGAYRGKNKRSSQSTEGNRQSKSIAGQRENLRRSGGGEVSQKQVRNKAAKALVESKGNVAKAAFNFAMDKDIRATVSNYKGILTVAILADIVGIVPIFGFIFNWILLFVLHMMFMKHDINFYRVISQKRGFIFHVIGGTVIEMVAFYPEATIFAFQAITSKSQVVGKTGRRSNNRRARQTGIPSLGPLVRNNDSIDNYSPKYTSKNIRFGGSELIKRIPNSALAIREKRNPSPELIRSIVRRKEFDLNSLTTPEMKNIQKGLIRPETGFEILESSLGRSDPIKKELIKIITEGLRLDKSFLSQDKNSHIAQYISKNGIESLQLDAEQKKILISGLIQASVIEQSQHIRLSQSDMDTLFREMSATDQNMLKQQVREEYQNYANNSRKLPTIVTLGEYSHHHSVEEILVKESNDAMTEIFDLHGYDASSWITMSSGINKIIKFHTSNFTRATEIEAISPGIVKKLNERQGISHFGRYPHKLLLQQERLQSSDSNYSLLIGAHADHNGSFYQSHNEYQDLYEQLGTDYPLRIFEVNSRVSLLRKLSFARSTYKGKIDNLIIAGHGEASAIHLSDGGKIDERLDSSVVSLDAILETKTDKSIGIMFNGSPNIVLQSCSTGKEGAIGQAISRKYSARVYGPEAPTSIDSFDVINTDIKPVIVPTYKKKQGENLDRTYTYGKKDQNMRI